MNVSLSSHCFHNKMSPPTSCSEDSTNSPTHCRVSDSGSTQCGHQRMWERVWTLSEIRNQASHWSLAGDAGLLNWLEEFSQKTISHTNDIEQEMDGLVHETKLTGVRLNNVINQFMLLANTQFIENRVYDEDISQDSSIPEQRQQQSLKTKEKKEEDVIPKVLEALRLGVNVIEEAFEQLSTNLGDSDSDDEHSSMGTNVLLEPKDPYICRPLPCMIGSTAFTGDDNVGLLCDTTDEDRITDHGSDSESEESEGGGELYGNSIPPVEGINRLAIDTSRKPAVDVSESSSDGDLDDDDDDEDLFEVDDVEEDDIKRQQRVGSYESRPDVCDEFASELAARLGSAAPKSVTRLSGSGRSDERGSMLGHEKTTVGRVGVEQEATVTRELGLSTGGESGRTNGPPVEQRGRKKTSDTPVTQKGSRLQPEVSDDDLFGQIASMDDDSDIFGKTGSLFSSSKGLFDDDEDDSLVFSGNTQTIPSTEADMNLFSGPAPGKTFTACSSNMVTSEELPDPLGRMTSSSRESLDPLVLKTASSKEPPHPFGQKGTSSKEPPDLLSQKTARTRELPDSIGQKTASSMEPPHPVSHVGKVVRSNQLSAATKNVGPRGIFDDIDDDDYDSLFSKDITSDLRSSGMTETAPTPSITPLTAGTAPISSLTPLTTASLFSDDDDDDDLFAALRHTKDTLRSTHRPTDSTDRSVSRFPSQKGHANEVSNHTAVISVISNSSRVPHYSTVISVASDSMTAPSLFDDLKDDLFTSVIATQRFRYDDHTTKIQ